MTAAWPAAALEQLRRGLPVLVLSSHANGDPHSTYSWAVARDDRRLRFVVDAGSVTGANLARRGRGAVQVVGGGGVNLLISGAVRQLADHVPAAEPADMELWEIEPDAVKDQAWPGVATSALVYRWPAERRGAMRRMERALYAELRAGPDAIRPGSCGAASSSLPRDAPGSN